MLAAVEGTLRETTPIEVERAGGTVGERTAVVVTVRRDGEVIGQRAKNLRILET